MIQDKPLVLNSRFSLNENTNLHLLYWDLYHIIKILISNTTFIGKLKKKYRTISKMSKVSILMLYMQTITYFIDVGYSLGYVSCYRN